MVTHALVVLAVSASVRQPFTALVVSGLVYVIPLMVWILCPVQRGMIWYYLLMRTVRSTPFFMTMPGTMRETWQFAWWQYGVNLIAVILAGFTIWRNWYRPQKV